MNFLIPVGDSARVNLGIWNTSTGEYEETQKFKLHMNFVASYNKLSTSEISAGVCFHLEEPYGFLVDCFTVEGGKDPIDNVINLNFQSENMKEEYTVDAFSQRRHNSLLYDLEVVVVDGM